MLALVGRYLGSHHLALLALFVALGGTGYAATVAKKNSVVSKSIKNGTVASADVKNHGLTGIDIHDASLTGALVTDDSLTGRAVDETSLGQVPSAATAERASSAGTADAAGRAGHADTADSADRLGGIGPGQIAIARSERQDPEILDCGTGGFQDCATVTVDLPRPARLLVTATGIGVGNPGPNIGGCVLEVDDDGTFLGSAVFKSSGADDTEGFAATGVSEVLPAGSHHADLTCKSNSGPPTEVDGSQLSVLVAGDA